MTSPPSGSEPSASVASVGLVHVAPGPTPTRSAAAASAEQALESAQAGIEQAFDSLHKPRTDVTGGTATPGGNDLQSPARRAALMKIIDQTLRASSRTAAWEVLVEQLQREFPGATIRVVTGDQRIESMIDARLGWLASSNQLRDEADSFFQVCRQAIESIGLPPGSPAGLMWLRGQWVVDLANRENRDRIGRHALLWIRPSTIGVVGPQRASDRDGVQPAGGAGPQWLAEASAVIGGAIASRPRFAVPGWIGSLASGGLLSIGAGVTLLSIAAFFPVRYPVHCKTTIAALSGRVICSPFEATLMRSHVNPGDAVHQGQLLLELDGRPLRMESESLQAEIQQTAKEHDIAMATGNIAQSQQSHLKHQQLLRRSELIATRLKQLEITSPIDGVVIGGDLDRYVGTTLTLGQTLLEVAPLSHVAVEVQIPEFEVRHVSSDADLRIRFAAVGGPSVSTRLDRVDPAAEVIDDQNVFIGRTQLANPDGVYRPGMTGDAVIDGPIRPWVWSHIRGGWERVLWWVGY